MWAIFPFNKGFRTFSSFLLMLVSILTVEEPVFLVKGVIHLSETDNLFQQHKLSSLRVSLGEHVQGDIIML